MTVETVPLTQSLVTIGVDPGARNTAVSVRQGREVLYSATIRRDDKTIPTDWARESVDFVLENVIPLFPNYQLGVEDVVVPQSHMNGRKSMISPKNPIHLALVVGGFVLEFRDAVVVRPGKNGSQPLDFYPDSLRGRRPKDLPGINNAGTRDHERSAYDVAGVADQLFRERKTQPGGHKPVSRKTSKEKQQ